MNEPLRQPLVIEVTELSAGTFVAALAGEMDIATSPELTTRLATVRGPVPYYVLVDLSELTFIDSTGIKALVSSAKELEARGGGLIVFAPMANVQRVFDIVQLPEVLTIVPSLDDAIVESQRRTGEAAPLSGA
jgi:anti-anti-sigma factor